MASTVKDIYNIFAQNEQGIQASFKEMHTTVLVKDKRIASWLGISQPEHVTIMRKAIETYDWISYKQSTQQEVLDVEVQYRNGECNTAQNNTIQVTEQNILLITENGTYDYGTDEMMAQISANRLNKEIKDPDGIKSTREDNPSTKTTINSKNNSGNKMEETAKETEMKLNTSETHVNTGKETIETEEPEGIKNTREKNLKKENETNSNNTGHKKKETLKETETKSNTSEIYLNIVKETAEKNKISTKEFFTIWDVPTHISAQQLRKSLSFYGWITVVEWKYGKDSKAAYIRITKFKNYKRELDFTNSWAVSLENGKLVRLTEGRFNKDELIERNRYKARLVNLPRTTVEALLLRRVRTIGAKSVYIPRNRHGNQRTIAVIYFGTEEKLANALKASVFYFNTRLEWIGHGEEERFRKGVKRDRTPEPIPRMEIELDTKGENSRKITYKRGKPSLEQLKENTRQNKRPRNSSLTENKEKGKEKNRSNTHRTQVARTFDSKAENKENIDTNMTRKEIEASNSSQDLWQLLAEIKTRFKEIEWQIAQRS